MFAYWQGRLPCGFGTAGGQTAQPERHPGIFKRNHRQLTDEPLLFRLDSGNELRGYLPSPGRQNRLYREWLEGNHLPEDGTEKRAAVRMDHSNSIISNRQFLTFTPADTLCRRPPIPHSWNTLPIPEWSAGWRCWNCRRPEKLCQTASVTHPSIPVPPRLPRRDTLPLPHVQ